MKNIILAILIFLPIIGLSQESKTSDFFSQIQKYDISDLWTSEKFQIELDPELVPKSRPIGYIGEKYQRIFVKLISAIQNPNDKTEYFIYGKTKVKQNICTFQGTIRIKISRTYDIGDVPNLTQGYVKGEYIFYEDPDQKGTGTFKGEFKTAFFINENGEIKYDALSFVADGFKNNQFEGTWTSYKSQSVKTCNWGDYRIPNSNELDGGAGEFSPMEEYADNGWKNYRIAFGYSEETPKVREALKRETEKWWLENK
ncbi:hypothetical protein [Carboxylicivirga marina]|uniref:hypothetical protein n=1 Tax=Carboxylicivirga marina TaxID=2800988 RepID=UPI002599691C|nr:hypothetical protein [uncultured Carboxylicivirga sp.]